MSLLNQNRQPTRRDLHIFGAILLAFGLIVAGLVFVFTASWTAVVVIGAISLFITIIYFALPPLRPLVYGAWMAIFYPVGWLISHTLLALTYYGVITPIGVLMRIFGYDPLRRKLDPDRDSEWSEHSSDQDTRRYFQQF
ncbi:MAG: SxtJ family membrane protein [Gammaproteobacteria bacterium]|nr:SxtJ family membrane protein [Gammaproteobacteria bacterium]